MNRSSSDRTAYRRALDASPIRADVALPSWYLALGGEHTEDWVKRAQALLRERFGDGETSMFPSTPLPGQLVAYAYSDVRMPFTVPFAPVQGGLRFEGVDVEGFGVWDPAAESERSMYEARVGQVLVHHHRFAFEYDPDGTHEDDGPSDDEGSA